MSKFLKQSLTIFASMLIVVMTTYNAYALGGGDWLTKQYGKWTKDLRDPKTGVLKSGVEVTAKSSKGLVSKIIKNPSTLRTAKFLAGGIGYALIDTAIKEMLNATDFVLDPANNTIRYTQKETVTDYLCKAHGGDYVDPQSACNSFSNPKNSKHITLIESRAYFKNDTYYCYIKKKYFRAINIHDSAMTCKHIESDAQQDKEMTLDELAELIKQQAEAGNKTAQDLLTEVVKEMGEAGELDAELDAALQPDSNPCQTGYKPSVTTGKCVPETTTETDPKPEAEPQPLKLPAFCEWTGMCPEWLKTRENTEKTSKNTEEMKEQDKTFYQTVTEFFDFMQFEDIEKDDDTEIEPEEPELPVNSVNVNFSKTCPADKQIPFSLVGRQMNITISYANLCQLAVSLSWLVKVLSTMMAAYILTGIRS